MKYPYVDSTPSEPSIGHPIESPAVDDAQHVDGRDEQAACPRLVTRGESFSEPQPTPAERYRVVTDHTGRSYIEFINEINENAHKLAAMTDWLNFSFPLEFNSAAINEFYERFIAIVGKKFYPMRDRGMGSNGWSHSYQLGQTKGLFAIGGQKGKAWVSLPGQACSLISNSSWITLAELLQYYGAKITRWDGAVDNYNGEYSVDYAVELFKQGKFITKGNKPKCRIDGDWIEPNGSGRTLYIGKPESGKILRIYEKGKQLGDQNSPWVRWELQLGCKDREIPFKVLVQPGQYVAGSYECMSWVHEESSRVETAKNTAKISYDHMVKHASRGYGKLIAVMLEVEGSAEKVVEMLIREGIPNRLNIPIPPNDSEPQGDGAE